MMGCFSWGGSRIKHRGISSRFGPESGPNRLVFGPLPALRNALAALERALDGRVWLPPSLAATLTGNRRRTIGTLDALLARLAQVREGFASLPIDEALPQQTPEPIAIGA